VDVRLSWRRPELLKELIGEVIGAAISANRA
jgi:hypothetical protein